MLYELKNCRTGAPAERVSTVDIKKDGDILTFYFHCENTEYWCPHDSYNDIHSEGDACEILIGTDPCRKVYYEMEISAKGELMLAEMTNHGFDENGEPILDIGFIPTPFIKGNLIKTELGYDAEISFDINNLKLDLGKIYFNAYRIETDGGYPDKYLFALSPTLRPKFHVPDNFLYLEDYI